MMQKKCAVLGHLKRGTGELWEIVLSKLILLNGQSSGIIASILKKLIDRYYFAKSLQMSRLNLRVFASMQ